MTLKFILLLIVFESDIILPESEGRYATRGRIIKGIDKVDTNKLVRFNIILSQGHSIKITKPRAVTPIKQYGCYHKVVNNWNELPHDVVQEDSINSFK